MCQVSSSELGLVDPCVDLGIDVVEGALERGIDGAQTWKRGGDARAQETLVDAAEEQGHPEAEFGHAILEAGRQALDQAVQAQTAQLIGDGALGDRFWIASGQSREMAAQIDGTEAWCELPEQDDGLPQRVDAPIGKAQTGGALPARGLLMAWKGIFGQHTFQARTTLSECCPSRSWFM
jgi:hypothetical protein